MCVLSELGVHRSETEMRQPTWCLFCVMRFSPDIRKMGDLLAFQFLQRPGVGLWAGPLLMADVWAPCARARPGWSSIGVRQHPGLAALPEKKS